MKWFLKLALLGGLALSIVYTAADPIPARLKRFSDFGNQTAYEILGIQANASFEEGKAAYRTLVKKYHPDQNQLTPDTMLKLQAINVAWNHLRTLEKEAKPTPDMAAAYAARAYAKTFGQRDVELMQLLDSQVDRRTHKLIDEAAVDTVAEFLGRRYGPEFDEVLRLIKENLFRDLASELLVRASVKFFLKKYPQWSENVVEIIRSTLHANLEIRAESYLSSPVSRAEATQLIRLIAQLDQARDDFGPKRKGPPRKKSLCEELFSR